MTVNNTAHKSLGFIKSVSFVAFIIIAVFFLFLLSYHNNATAGLYDDNEVSTIDESLSSGLENCTEQIGGSPTSVAIETDKTTYITGSQIFIYTYVSDESGCPIVERVKMQIKHIDPEPDLNEYVQTFYTDSNPFYVDELSFSDDNPIVLDHPGRFNITLTTLINGSEETSWKLIEVKDFSQIRSAVMLYIGVASFAGLITVIILGVLGRIKNYAIGEILRFIFISGIMLSIIISFTFVEQEFGTAAPVGLVMKSNDPEDPNASPKTWVINIGGTQEDRYSTGIQIPISIFVFGIAGGYLRYLYKTSRSRPKHRALESAYLFTWENIPGIEDNKLKDFLKEYFNVYWIENEQFQRTDKTISISDGKNSISIIIDDKYERAKLIINNTDVYQFIIRKENGTAIYQDMNWRDWIFHQSLEDIAILFLSPLLAIAVWFLLQQAGLQGVFANYTLAAVSFTVGLITEEVVQALIHFIQSVLRTTEKEESQVRKEEGKATMTGKSTQS